jgi:predicted naringenin-chalcone synthase
MPTPRILSVATAHPPERFTQEEVLAMSPYTDERRRGFFLHSGVEGRYLAIDRETFRPEETIDELAARFKKSAIDMGCRALSEALSGAGIGPRDLDFLVTTTCTGRLCPSLDAHLIHQLGMREEIQRVHVGDTGCSSTIVSLQQAVNYLNAFPGRRAAVVASEVSSTGYYLDDDLETAVANAIFADGAGALVLGTEGNGPQVLGHRTLFRSRYLDLMGFTFPAGRQRILLSKDVRSVASEMMGELVGLLLDEHRIGRSEVRHWVLHSAGQRVLERAQGLLGLSDQDLGPARRVLARYGNMSSATVIFVYQEAVTAGRPKPGEVGVMVALGPGFAAEGALLRW